jgi:hypothetical protein
MDERDHVKHVERILHDGIMKDFQEETREILKA